MQAIRQHEAGGPLTIETIAVPSPGPGEVLIRMFAAPINPSDLAMLKGSYLSRPYPFTPGLEGSGTVLGSGGGILAGMRSGKRVACSPNPGKDGTWAEYLVTSALRTVPLPAKIDHMQGAMMLVNPMTAMAFLKLAREGKHRALVNNAAASALGKMLGRLCAQYNIPLINIVRNKAQLELLKETGEKYILNSKETDFEKKLEKLAAELNATLFLDAVTGPQTSVLLRAAPRGATILTYARLSGEPMDLDPAMFINEEKLLLGFQLGNWLQHKSLIFKLKFTGQVKKHMQTLLTSQINQTFTLDQVQKALDLYKSEMSAGKVLLIPPPL